LRVLPPPSPFRRDRFGTLAKNGETWERRAAVERLNVAANSSTNAGTSGGQASNQLPFFVDRRRFSPVADAPFRNLFTSSAATSEAELIQQRSETRR
jgi:hypothetical protein